ncbi:hypothetical protein ACHAPT_012980 [Fusarium lateritium]
MSDSEESASDSSARERAASEGSDKKPTKPQLVIPDKNQYSDDESTISELSDPETDELLSLANNSDNDDDKTQPLGLSRPWGWSDYDDYDVITVHGLRDDHNTVWTSETGNEWVGKQLFEHLSVRQLDYLYATDESARIFQENGIKAEARNLLRLYSENRRELSDTEVDRPIIWVLIEAAQATLAQDYEDEETWQYMKEVHRRIATLSTTIVFLGCPHQAESIDVLEDELHNLICLPGPDLTNGVIRKVKTLAQQVEKTNLQFLDTKLLSRLVSINVFHLDPLETNESSTETTANVGSATSKRDEEKEPCTENSVESQKDRLGAVTDASNAPSPASKELPTAPASPFSRYTLTMHHTFVAFNISCQGSISHADLARGVDNADFSEDWVGPFKERFNSEDFPLKVNPSLIHLQTALLSMAPPTRPPRVHMDPNVSEAQQLPFLNWFASQDAYKTFDNTIHPCALYIEGATGDAQRTAMLTQHMYAQYESSRMKLWGADCGGAAFYFEFSKFDNRYNNIRSMLISFINDMTWHAWRKSADAPVIRRVLECLGEYRFWSLPDLFKLFTDVKKCPSVRNIALFLCCFDECVEEERTWFLTRVMEQYGRNDQHYLIVITTSGPDSSIKKFVPDSQVLSMEDCPTGPKGYAIEERGRDLAGLEPALQGLFKKRPILKRLEADLNELMDECRHAPHLGYRITDWLGRFGRGAPIADIRTALGRLRPLTSENILRVFVESLSPDDQRLARLIYRWVKYALEPLTVEALGHAIAATTLTPEASLLDLDHEQLVDDLSRIFSGIIIIENREVKFSHPSFYSATLPESEHEKPIVAHCQLAEACLKYLMHPEVQQQYHKLSVDNYAENPLHRPLILPRNDLLEYAVRFWPEHYRLGNDPQLGAAPLPTELALHLLRNKEVRHKWAEAYYLLSNPFTRIQRSYLSLLPIMASLGLQDLLSLQIREDKTSEWFQQDAWLAITEAARNGHTDIVSELVSVVEVQQSGLQDALYWAAFPGNQDTVAELLSKVQSPRAFSRPESILCRAVAAVGLAPLVSVLCKAGLDLSQINHETGQTLIHTAIFWGEYEIVRVLLNSGADLSVRDSDGDTPLHLAARMGQPAIVQLLIDHKADLNVKDSTGSSAVHIAIGASEHAALDVLLNAGADFKSDDPVTGNPPLTLAADSNSEGCIRVLLEHGADPRTPSSNESALYRCCNRADMIDTCRLLLEHGADPNESSEEGEMLIIRALGTGSKELASLLIEYGAELNVMDPCTNTEMRTPFSKAVWDCSIDTLEFLMEKGALVNYAPPGSFSPLFTAAFQGTEIEKAKFLLSKGADITWRRQDGWNVLHACYDSPEFVQLLLEHGADPNVVCDDWGTPLMMAARWGYLDSLKILVAHQSPKTGLDNTFLPSFPYQGDPKTALNFAVADFRFDCAVHLLEAGAKLDDKFENPANIIRGLTCEISNEQLPDLLSFVKLCLQRGTNAEYVDGDGNTVLHSLTRRIPEPLIKLLIDSGAPVDTPNAQGLTPLAVAVKEYNIGVMSYLISRGARADLFIQSVGGLLYLACEKKHVPGETYLEMVQILIQAGVDPNEPPPRFFGDPLLYRIICDALTVYGLRRVVKYFVSDLHMDVNQPGRSGEAAILAVTRDQNFGMIRYLIRHGADVNVADDQGRRIAHLIACRWTPDQGLKMMRRLVKAGADLHAPDNYGRTPFHLAAGYGSHHMARAIIKASPQGFDVNLKDADGWTPLMFACRVNLIQDDLLEMLVTEYGADVWPVSNDGEWSARKIAGLIDPSGREYLLKYLEPPEDKRERVGPDGIKQVWDSAFHTAPPKEYLEIHESTCQGCQLSGPSGNLDLTSQVNQMLRATMRWIMPNLIHLEIKVLG